jgi:uncharacterized protein
MEKQDWLNSYREIEDAARQGDARAQFQLGELYFQNMGIPPEEASKWFWKAAEQGHAGAQYFLGIYFFSAGGGEVSKEAIQWFQKSARQGYPPAQRLLGSCYWSGDGVKKNLREALKWFRKSAAQGDGESLFRLGVGYAEGSGVKKSLKKGVEYFHRAAKEGYTDAQYALGLYYRCGNRKPGDKEEAQKWLARAAALGHSEALKELKKAAPSKGRNGRGKNWKERIEEAWEQISAEFPKTPEPADQEERDKLIYQDWLIKAAEEGNPAAQVELGDLCYSGLEMKEDYEKAFQWYSKAAEGGNPSGLYSLGIMHEHGRFVERDPAKALAYFEKAAHLGDVPSQIRAAAMLFLGQGGPQDFLRAEEYIKKFASPNDDLKCSNIKMFLFELAIGLTGKPSSKIPSLYYMDGLSEKRKTLASKTYLRPFMENKDELFLSYDDPKSEFEANGFGLGAEKFAWKSPGHKTQFKPYSWKGFQGMNLRGPSLILKSGSTIPFLMPEYEQRVLFNLLKVLHKMAWMGAGPPEARDC